VECFADRAPQRRDPADRGEGDRRAAEPAASHPGPERAAVRRDLHGEVEFPGGDLEVVAHRAVRGGHQAANRRVVPGAKRLDGVKHALVFRDDVPGAAEGLLVEPVPGREQLRRGDVAQCPDAEGTGGPLARRAPCRVPAGDVLVLDLGVDDEHRERGRVEAEVHGRRGAVTAVEE
jgi:hypothetical protein